MSEKVHVGVAWEEETISDPTKQYYQVALDLGGLMPSISCRIVENGKRKSEGSPSHSMFYSPVDGDDRHVGAFWPYKSEETGTAYLTGQIEVWKLGVIDLKGGGKVDFRLSDRTIRLKLVAAKDVADDDSKIGKKRPTHYLLRLTRRGKKAAVDAAEPNVEQLAEDEATEEQEAA